MIEEVVLTVPHAPRHEVLTTLDHYAKTLLTE